MIYVKTLGPLGHMALLFGLLGTAFAEAPPRPIPQNLSTVTLTSGMHNIVAQLAETPEQRSVGLMFRTRMAAHEGMLFVFESATKQCFWMRNTMLPLSIAFLRDDGSIVNIADMKPQSDNAHCSDEPVRYALEMNVGWYAKRGLTAGSKISGPHFKR